jgi:multiple antibiotic resistance protein
MSSELLPFIHLVLVSFVALFPVVNPVGSAFMVAPYFKGLSFKDRRRAVRKIAFYALSICVVSLFAGKWILELFGLSIPVIQIAGGIMICKMGWEFLSDDGTDTAPTNPDADTAFTSLEGKLFYPISFPTTTGAGTISVIFTLGAHAENEQAEFIFLNIIAIIVAVFGMCLMIYFLYLNTDRLLRYLGTKGQVVINRISAFLIFCVGLQIATTGLLHLFKK